MNTDSDIFRRSGQNPRAFAELFDRHAPVIARFAHRRVGADAFEDVVSETFLIAYRKRASFDLGAESALPWLLGIAARVIHRHRAAEARQWRALATSEGLGQTEADAISRADDRGDAALDAARLAPALARLSRRDRDTLLLYAWGDLTYEQIAEAQGVPVGTVRSRLNRARRQLSTARGISAAQHTPLLEGRA